MTTSHLSRRNLFWAGLAKAGDFARHAFAGTLQGDPLVQAGRDVSPKTGGERQAIPSACWQCVTRDAIVGYVEDGRLVKIEGNPKSQRTNGKLCARGQAGMNQSYDPDRILYPMKHVGKERGDGQWKRISWDEALGELTARLKKLKDAGTPEKFMFHYGRMKASSSKIIKSYFLQAYGTGTIGNHTAICEGAKWTGQELTWGKHYDVNDVQNTNFVLNFGCNVFEAHTNHLPLSQRLAQRSGNGQCDIVTFDVRLSNTAARSREWIPIRPGTDLAVLLAMSSHLIGQGKVDRDFIETWTNVTVDQLRKHLAQYTPKWAEGVSGVPAAKIAGLADELWKRRPSTVMTYRGAVANYHGPETERAAMMLEAIVGTLNRKGGRVQAVGAKWKSSFSTPKSSSKKLKILDGDGLILPTHHASHQVLRMIAEGKHGRPEIYMTYCYNPAYVNGDCGENIRILKDKSLIPYLVAVDVGYTETAALADLILPDTVYTERWDWEDHASMDHVPEYYIRQPLIPPLGECRDFKDVCCDLARRLGGDVAKAMPFTSAEEFVRDACETTPDVKAAGGFDYMKANGALVPPGAKPKYEGHTKELGPGDLAGAILDEKTGVWWKGEEGQDYTSTKKSYSKYVGQQFGDKVCVGFKPDKVNKSGKLELHSSFLEKAGWPALPSWIPIPEHEKKGANELILTSFKVATQTHSRTQNCKLLTELFHDNPAWINPVTAKMLGIEDGGEIEVESSIGKIKTRARVTAGIVPGTIAISNHCGHWAYGRYASGKPAPWAREDDPDLGKIWWKEHGVHPNWVIPNAPAPVSGQIRTMDTVVRVRPV